MKCNIVQVVTDIKANVYPEMKRIEERANTAIVSAEKNMDMSQRYRYESYQEARKSQASAANSSSWADAPIDENVVFHKYDASSDTIKPITLDGKYSAKHWAEKAKTISREQQWVAEAWAKTAESMANEDYGIPVRVYTSNGDGTFTETPLPGVFSAKHYRIDTANTSGQKRWVESLVAVEGQAVFGFSKPINHADVYVDGVRKLVDVDYTTYLKDIRFAQPLKEGQTVTVSGMEALTGSEFQDLLEETKAERHRAQLSQWEAQAAKMTSESYAAEPYNQHVKEYTSNGDGTFTVTETSFYSALHWSMLMEMNLDNITILDSYYFLNLINVNDAKVVYLRGAYKLNDGGEGFYAFDPSKSGINNGGTIINGWVRQFSGPTKAVWFGIHPISYYESIGVKPEDETNKIINMLRWDDEVYFDSGKYLISDKIEFNDKSTYFNNTVFYAKDVYNPTGIVTFRNFISRNMIGEFTVELDNDDNTKQSCAISIVDSQYSTYNLSSIGGAVGISIKSVSSPVVENTFNIGTISNSTVGLEFNYANEQMVLNTVNSPIIITRNQSETDITDAYYDRASCIYIEDSSKISGNTINNVSAVLHNDNTKVFIVGGDNNFVDVTKMYIDSAITLKTPYAEINGSNNIFDLTRANDLKYYPEEDSANGIVSTIENNGTDTVILGPTASYLDDGRTISIKCKTKKSILDIENEEAGFDCIRVTSESKTERAGLVRGKDGSQTELYPGSDKYSSGLDSTTVAFDSVTVDSEHSTNTIKAYEANIVSKDTPDKSSTTDHSIVFTDTVHTGSFSKTGTSVENSSDGSKNKTDSVSVEITKDTYKNSIEYDSIVISDSSNSSSVDIDSTKVKLVDNSGNTYQSTATETSHTNGDNKSILDSNKLGIIDSANGNEVDITSEYILSKSGTIEARIDNDLISIKDTSTGEEVAIDKNKAIFTNVNNVSTLEYDKLKIEDTSSGDSCTTTQSGVLVSGSAHSVDISSQDITISDTGSSSSTTIDSTSRVVVGGTTVEFNGSKAPTTGTYKIGDKIFKSDIGEDTVAGWICVKDGSPGTWRELRIDREPNTSESGGTPTAPNMLKYKTFVYDVNGDISIQNPSGKNIGDSGYIIINEGTDGSKISWGDQYQNAPDNIDQGNYIIEYIVMSDAKIWLNVVGGNINNITYNYTHYITGRNRN
jgi:hypothetical protein